MSKTVEIKSAEQFSSLLKSSRIVVADCKSPCICLQSRGIAGAAARRLPTAVCLACDATVRRAFQSFYPTRRSGSCRVFLLFLSFFRSSPIYVCGLMIFCLRPLARAFGRTTDRPCCSLRQLVRAVQADCPLLRAALEILVPVQCRHLRQDQRRVRGR